MTYNLIPPTLRNCEAAGAAQQRSFWKVNEEQNTAGLVNTASSLVYSQTFVATGAGTTNIGVFQHLCLRHKAKPNPIKSLHSATTFLMRRSSQMCFH